MKKSVLLFDFEKSTDILFLVSVQCSLMKSQNTRVLVLVLSALLSSVIVTVTGLEWTYNQIDFFNHSDAASWDECGRHSDVHDWR